MPRPMYKCTCLGLCALFAGSAVAADPVPPPPNPANPVNYVEWINQTYGGDVKDNAYDAYRKVYEQITPFEGDWKAVTSGPWSDNQAASDWLSAHRRALMHFRRAAAKPACFFPLEVPEQVPGSSSIPFLFDCVLRTARPHRDACRGLLADGYRAWAEGDHKRLPPNALVALRSGRHLDNSPVLIMRLVGIACAELGYESLRFALDHAEHPAALAADLISELNAADPPWPTLESALLCERLCAWDICQRVFVPGTKEGTWTADRESLEALCRQAELPAHSCAGVGETDYRQTLNEFDAYYDAVDDWMRLPYHQAAGQAAQLARIAEGSKNVLVQTFATPLHNVRVLCESIAAERRATHLICHLLTHRAKSGAYPASLDELQASDLAQLRVDPFSGKDFVYRKTADGFTLYTVAQDLKDDGGRHDERWGRDGGGDFVFWPVPD